MDVVGDLRFAATRTVVGPTLRKVKFAVDESVTARTLISDEDADLLILNAARRARIHAFDAGALRSLLQKTGLIDDQHALVVRGRWRAEVPGDLRPQIVADFVGAPAGPPDEMLNGVGRRVADELGELPAVLAFDAGRQTAEVDACKTMATSRHRTSGTVSGISSNRLFEATATRRSRCGRLVVRSGPDGCQRRVSEHRERDVPLASE